MTDEAIKNMINGIKKRAEKLKSSPVTMTKYNKIKEAEGEEKAKKWLYDVAIASMSIKD